jgi:hypothetical protein
MQAAAGIQHNLGAMSNDEDLDLIEPHCDIHALFRHYARLYFHDALGPASVEWSSSRMTL